MLSFKVSQGGNLTFLQEDQLLSEEINRFSECMSIKTFLENFEHDPFIEEKRGELLLELMRLTKKVLTARQYQILSLLLEGKSQREVAEDLGICQTSISLALIGTPSKYTSANPRKPRYGGIINKIKKNVKTDDAIQKILQEIENYKIERSQK